MILSCSAVAQQQKTLLDLRRVGNDSTYTATAQDIVKNNTYTFITNTIGAVHGVLRARVLFKNQLSGYLVLDSVYAVSGLTRYTTAITGDSLMNVWLPDDGQDLAEEELKVLRGWQLILTFETKSSGNTGTVLVVTSQPTAFTPAPTPELYVRLSVFSDTLDRNVCRTCTGGTGDTTGVSSNPMLTNLENDVAGKADADSIAQQIALVKNLIAGKADADSIHTALVTLNNLIAGKPNADSIHTAILSLQNLVAGHADADSISQQVIAIKNMIAGKADADSLSFLFGRGRAVVSVHDYVWSDTSHSWTTVFQNAIDSCKGKILYVPGGVYEFDAQGECPYEAGKEFILDMKTGNTALWLSPGATLKLNAELQVDSAVNFIVWKDAKDIYIGGGGTVMLNASAQPDWATNGGATWASDEGYCQGDAGNIIEGYQTGTEYDASSNITVENLVMKDCFSNPVDIHGASNSVLRNIRAWSFGEGPQFVRGKNVVMDNIFVSDKHEAPYWTAGGVGDGIECAACIDFVISNCVVKDYQSTGGIDISYSRRGTVTGCIIDSAAGLLGAQSPLGNYYTDDVTVSNCIVTKAGGHAVQWTSPGTGIFSGIIIDSTASGAAGIYVADNIRPVYISGCVFRHMEYGIYTTNGRINISACSFDSVAHGVVMGRGADNQSPVVHITGSRFQDCSIAGVQINAAGDATYDARGSVTGSSFGNCPYMPIRFPNAADADSLNFHYSYLDLNGNKFRTNSITYGTDSIVVATQGYVDTRIAGLSSVFATTSAVSDSLAARFLAISDSLLGMRGFVRLVVPGMIADTLAKYSYGIMAGDSAALAAVLDAMYARSGGGAAVDTSLLVGNNRDDLDIKGDKWFKGDAMVTKELWIYDSTRAAYRNVLEYDNYVFNIGKRADNYTYFWSNNAQMMSISCGVALETINNAHVWVKGGSKLTIGTAAIAGANTKPLYVASAGGARIDDTLRVGDYTTYTYIIPGGDPVKSSTREIKTDISTIETPADFAARVLSVSPKRYRFKPEAYLRGISDTLVGKERDDALATDAAQAAKQSERVLTGFIAEEFNPAFSSRPNSKEIDTGEIMAALWKANQELLRRVADLETRVKKLEGR